MAKRFHRLRARGAAIGRSLAGGVKGTVVAGGSGAAAFFIHDAAQKNISFLADKPWAAPLGLLAVGHVMKQRRALVTPGVAVCGAAGYALGNALNFMFATKRAAAANAPASGTNGLFDQDTGALLEAGAPIINDPYAYDVPSMGDVGALVMPGNVNPASGMSAAHSIGT